MFAPSFNGQKPPESGMPIAVPIRSPDITRAPCRVNRHVRSTGYAATMDDVPQTQTLPARRRGVAVPLVLFVLTCASTWYTGKTAPGGSPSQGFVYSAALMTILLSH